MSSQRPRRVLVADDHGLVRSAIRDALEADGAFEIVAEAIDGAEVLPLLRQTPEVDLILLDIRMPRLDGLGVLARLRELGSKVPVVILSGSEEDGQIKSAFELGAIGYLSKTVDVSDLSATLRSVLAGAVVTLTAPDDAALAALTAREREVLALIAEGLPNPEIGRRLFLTTATVKWHARSLTRKLGYSNRTELARFAYEHGIV